jgi:hypothetical protein
VLAAILLVLLSSFHLLAGVATLAADRLDVDAGYTFRFGTDAWGWTHVALSVPALASGMGLLMATSWARSLGLLACVVSAIVGFAFAPVEATWSVIIVSLAVLLIALLVLRWDGRTRDG